MKIDFKSPLDRKKAFYNMASQGNNDAIARAKFKREPWHLTDMKLRKEVENAYRNRDNNGTDGV